MPDSPTPKRAGSQTAIWREGDTLVMTKGAELPSRCIKCNAPGAGRSLRMALQWTPLASSLTIFLGLLPYVIAERMVRRWAVVRVSLCSRHRGRRRKILAVTWLGLLGSVALIFLEVGQQSVALGIYAAGLCVFSLLLYSFAGQVVAASRIEDGCVRIEGAGAAFLATIPEGHHL